VEVALLQVLTGCRQRPFLLLGSVLTRPWCQATKGLAAEYGPKQIRVNSLLPLLSGTGLFETFVGVPFTPDNVKNFLGNVPLGRLADPTDVAKAALFLGKPLEKEPRCLG
jgi:NAD(P)-dependent dehydrogenase (short-subunit alcohol dehydrogenase family)